MVVAEGLGRGAGSLAGAVLHVAFRQLAAHPGQAPCAEPLAFFSVRGLMLPAPEAGQETSGVDGKPCAPALRPQPRGRPDDQHTGTDAVPISGCNRV